MVESFLGSVLNAVYIVVGALVRMLSGMLAENDILVQAGKVGGGKRRKTTLRECVHLRPAGTVISDLPSGGQKNPSDVDYIRHLEAVAERDWMEMHRFLTMPTSREGMRKTLVGFPVARARSMSSRRGWLTGSFRISVQINWIVSASDCFDFLPVTEMTAITIFDTAVMKFPESPGEMEAWELYAITALLIGAKFHEVDGVQKVRKLDTFVAMFTYTSSQRAKAEMRLLAGIHWSANTPTPQHFLDAYAVFFPVTVNDLPDGTHRTANAVSQFEALVAKRATFFCELHFLDNTTFARPPHIIAAAAISLARSYLHLRKQASPSVSWVGKAYEKRVHDVMITMMASFQSIMTPDE